MVSSVWAGVWTIKWMTSKLKSNKKSKMVLLKSPNKDPVRIYLRDQLKSQGQSKKNVIPFLFRSRIIERESLYDPLIIEWKNSSMVG